MQRADYLERLRLYSKETQGDSAYLQLLAFLEDRNWLRHFQFESALTLRTDTILQERHVMNSMPQEKVILRLSCRETSIKEMPLFYYYSIAEFTDGQDLLFISTNLFAPLESFIQQLPMGWVS